MPNDNNQSDPFAQYYDDKTAPKAGDDPFAQYYDKPKPEPMGAVAAGARGVGQALFGLGDEALAGAKALFDVYRGTDRNIIDIYEEEVGKERKEVERAAEERPGMYYTGLGAGLVGTALAGGAAAGLGKAASLGQQMRGAAALGGLSGFGASEGSVLKDPGQLAADVALGAGTGAAFQGVLGKGAEALKKLPALARKEAAERAVKATTGQNIRALRRMGQTTHASAGDIERQAENIRKVGQDILEETVPSGKPLLRGYEAIEDIAPKLSEARKAYGAQLGEVGKKVDAFYPKGSVQGANIAKKLRRYAKEIPPVDQRKALINRLQNTADDFDEVGPLTFKKAQLFKNQFKHKPDDADLLYSDKDVINKIRSIIGKEMDDTVDELRRNIDTELAKRGKGVAVSVTERGGIPPAVRGPQQRPVDLDEAARVRDLLGRYGELKGKYGTFKSAADAATDRALKNLSNRFVSPSDYGVGGVVAAGTAAATGNPAMLLLGAAGAAANKLARERGSAAAAAALRAVANAAENPNFVTKYGPKLMEAARRGPAAMAAAHAALAASDPDYIKQLRGSQ